MEDEEYLRRARIGLGRVGFGCRIVGWSRITEGMGLGMEGQSSMEIDDILRNKDTCVYMHMHGLCSATFSVYFAEQVYSMKNLKPTRAILFLMHHERIQKNFWRGFDWINVFGQTGLSKQCRFRSDVVNATSDQGLHCLPLTQQFQKLSCSKMNLLKRREV